VSTTPEPIAAWQEAHDRVCALAESDPAALEARVPATPDWSGRDLLSHMVGLGADVLGGDEPDDHNPAWTQAQVEARRGHSVADLVAEWRALAPDLIEWMTDHGSRPLNDAVIHEQDLRSALGVPGGRDSAGFAIVRDRRAEKFADAIDRPIRLVGESWSFGPDDAPTRLRAATA